MYYFDYLRMRNSLKAYALWFGCGVALLVVSLPFSHVGHGDLAVGVSGEALASHAYNGLALLHEQGQRIHIPFAIMCMFAMFVAIVFATGTSTSLSRFNKNLNFSFAKPVSRERSTLTTVGIDAVGIALAFAIALAFVLVPFAVVGVLDRITFDSDALAVVFLGLGVAYMWYGMVQAATSVMRGGSGLVLGLSWAVFGIADALNGLSTEYVPSVVVWFFHAVNHINPFTYLRIIFGAKDLGARTVDAFGPVYFENLAIVWLTACVAIAIAVALRKRMEV
jgi:hypothetical protein